MPAWNNLHSWAMNRVLDMGLRDFIPTATADIPPVCEACSLELPVRHVRAPAKLQVALDDEDAAPRGGIARWIVQTVNRLPVSDAPPSPEQSPEGLAERFTYLPTPHVVWPALDTAEGMGLFVRQGLGAHRLEDRDEGLTLDLDALSALTVRPGYAAYGGCAVLAPDGALKHLRFGDREVLPTDPDFASEAFRFRSTVMLAVTFFDHLGLTHYGAANTVLVATRRHLPADHPLRAFLKPFLFRTGAINANSLDSLLPDGALVHRCTALDAAGLEYARTHMFDGVRYRSFPDALRDAGIHPDQLGERAPLVPWGLDGLEFHDRVRRFVDQACAAFAWDDDAVHAWYADLIDDIPDLPPVDQLPAILTWFIQLVTALHAHVGHVVPYVRDPSALAGRVFPGATSADGSNSDELASVACLTGLKVPTLTGDWTHLMPNPACKGAAERFRDELDTLQSLIDERNATRPLDFVAFSPRTMPCSVSR